MRSYSRTRGWTNDDYAAAIESLRSRDLIDEIGFTETGHRSREAIETMTDAQMSPAIAALGDEMSELLAILQPWGAAVRAGFGYLQSRPHDLAKQAGDSRR